MLSTRQTLCAGMGQVGGQFFHWLRRRNIGVGPLHAGAVEHQALGALPGFKIVSFTCRHHAALAGTNAPAMPCHFKLKHTLQTHKDLKMLVIVTAV